MFCVLKVEFRMQANVSFFKTPPYRENAGQIQNFDFCITFKRTHWELAFRAFPSVLLFFCDLGLL